MKRIASLAIFSSNNSCYFIPPLRLVITKLSSEYGGFFRMEQKMNQPIREALQISTGWLVAPTVFIQLWFFTKEGITIRLKNTRLFIRILFVTLG